MGYNRRHPYNEEEDRGVCVMSQTLDYRKIWNDGGYGKDNLLENSLAYVKRCANQVGISKQVAEQIVYEVFLEMKNGRKFSLDKCSCGCGIDKSGTDVTHYMAARILEAARKQNEAPYLRKVVIPKKMSKIRRAYRILVGREV